ncbi:MAG: tetratricopeptide repeat protein [Candidatus Omnitrophica bacterium]|nr:tetratricopeptide repeat protein [Candidatus Omnitrophota bacterium]
MEKKPPATLQTLAQGFSKANTELRFLRRECIKKKLFLLFALTPLLIQVCFGAAIEDSLFNDKSPTVKNLYIDYINEGLKMLEAKEYSQAEMSFWRALNLLPDVPDAYINLAIVNIQRENLPEARQFLLEAENFTPRGYSKQPLLFYNLGYCLYLEKNYSKSADYYIKALDADPTMARAMYGLGLSYKKLGNADKAAFILLKAKNIFERTGDLVFLNKTNQALSGMEGEKISIPENPREKRIESTLDFFDTYTAANPLSKSEQFLTEGSRAYKNKKITEAMNLMKKSILLNPNNPQAYYRLGVVYASQQNFLESAECFREAVELDPKFVNAYINLGSSYGKLNKYSQALATLKKAIRFDKKNPKIYYNIGMIYASRGKHHAAKKYFNKAKKLCLKNNDSVLLEKINSFYTK